MCLQSGNIEKYLCKLPSSTLPAKDNETISKEKEKETVDNNTNKLLLQPVRETISVVSDDLKCLLNDDDDDDFASLDF